MNHKIILGDSREVIPTLEPESVTLVVTSPPYFVQREYESYLETETDFWNMISEVFHKINRVVEPFGKVVINFADRYSNSAVLGRACETLYCGKYDSIMNSSGFELWARVIWDKNRVYMNEARQHMSKNNKTGKMRVSPNWEYLFCWRKISTGKPPTKNTDMTDAERIKWTDSIWTISPVSINEVISGYRAAKFPEEVPYRFIKMFSAPEDLILDPFGGTATTTKVARDLGRRSICIEKNPAMRTHIEGYLNQNQVNMFQENSDVEFIDFP